MSQFKTQKWKSLLLNSVKSKLGIIIILAAFHAVFAVRMSRKGKSLHCPTGRKDKYYILYKYIRAILWLIYIPI